MTHEDLPTNAHRHSHMPNLGIVVGEHEQWLPQDEREAIAGLRAEAEAETDTTNRQEKLDAATIYGVDLAIQSMVQHEVAQNVDKLESDLEESRKLNEAIAEKVGVSMLAGESIGWLATSGPLAVPVERLEKSGRAFWFGSIVDKQGATSQAFNGLKDQGKAEMLVQQLTDSILPRFLSDLQSGNGKLRPVSRGGRSKTRVSAQRSLDTDYPGYKFYVQGTDNCAIVLLPGKREVGDRKEQVIILAALYDHEYQDRVTNTLFLKQK